MLTATFCKNKRKTRTSIPKKKVSSSHRITHKKFKNEQVPKSPWKTLDRKGANTFPFYNLPLVLRISRKRIFLYFVLFGWMK